MKKISIVIIGRDDNYGDDQHHGIYDLKFKPKTFIERIKFSLETNIRLFEKFFAEEFEYVVVDWSPMENKLLSRNIELSSILSHKCVKNVVINPGRVESVGLNPKGFYEYIGKNVGIRNCDGEYILVTNSDDYFTEDLVKEIWEVVESKNIENYYRPHSRKDVDGEFNVTGEGSSFYEGSIFGKIGTPAAGDFCLSHRSNIIEVGKGYNEQTLTTNDENMRQTALDGALLINMYLRGIKPYCLQNSIYSFDHNKLDRFNYFENLQEYSNINDWGMNYHTPETIDGIIYYQ
jgi:hypothetical protein